MRKVTSDDAAAAAAIMQASRHIYIHENLLTPPRFHAHFFFFSPFLISKQVRFPECAFAPNRRGKAWDLAEKDIHTRLVSLL